MPRRPATELRKTALAQAEALIAKLTVEKRDELPDIAELLACWPLVFRGALGHLLPEFDYEANRGSNTAIAVRLLAINADRFERVRASVR
jgi:hypothetical protein